VGTLRAATTSTKAFLIVDCIVICFGFNDQRIPDRQTLADKVAAWERERNTAEASVDWRFTMADTRVKLKRL